MPATSLRQCLLTDTLFKGILVGYLRLIFAAVVALCCCAAYGGQQRCLILGDSIQSLVYGPAGSAPDQSALTASRLPMLANVAIGNLSAPGQRMASSGYAGMGLISNLNVISYSVGGAIPNCIIITLGTNDWVSNGGGMEFINAYRQVVQYSKSMGANVICVPPLWRINEDDYTAHSDGNYKLSSYRDWVINVCFGEGAKVFDASNIGLVPSDFADGLHMNESGHIKFSNALLYSLRMWGILH